MNTPKVLIPVANGSDEMEVTLSVGILRKAGAQVVTAAVDATGNDCTVTGQIGIKFFADTTLERCLGEVWDLILLPGGKGAETLGKCAELRQLVSLQNRDKRLIAAICAGPVHTLSHWGMLDQKMATCYLPMEKDFKCGKFLREKVVCDENIITSQGPGTAIDFSLCLVEKLSTKQHACEVAEKIAYQCA